MACWKAAQTPGAKDWRSDNSPIGTGPCPRYISPMKTPRSTFDRILIGAIVALVASGAATVAFAGWYRHGADIFMTYASTGLSWCF